jgi:hypothetical protein
MPIQLSRANSGTPLTTADYNSDNLIVETAVNSLLGTSGNVGTVTSVSEVDTDTSSELFSANITNATTTPQITFSRINKAANLVYASPDGASGKPTMRALVSGDLPVVPNSKGGTGITDVMPNNQVLSKRSGTTKYTGITGAGTARIVVTPTTDNFEIDIAPSAIELNTLASTTPLTIAKGGTGQTSAQAAINALTVVSGVTDGWVLTKSGSNASWAAPTTHTGDVTGSVALTIAANAVTYAKMQIVGANKILGNPTGSAANASEITTCPNLVFVGDVLKQRESIFANKTANYTMTNLDGTIYGDATAAAFIVKLPDPSTLTIAGGEIFTVQRVNSGAKITVQTYLTDGTQAILGAASETSIDLTGAGHNIKVQYVGDISGVKTFRIISKII